MATDHIQSEDQLDSVLTLPRPALIEFIRSVSSPLVVLGAGGKMGATLAVLARRAADAAGSKLEIIAVSRFSDEAVRRRIEEQGVKTRCADLLEPESVRDLPDSANLIYLVGLKFGTTENPSMTWAVNTLAPANAAGRYRSARIVALSTGNVYPNVPVDSGGVKESHPLKPLGEYPNAAVARERVFEYCSRKNGTPVAVIRLNYAVELRYGVLVDIARKVWTGEPIDLANGSFNCIWQGDACEMILRALSLASNPPSAFNLCCPTIVSVREVASKFAVLFDRPARFTGSESGTALLSDPAKLCAQLGPPATSLDTVIRWTADWVRSGGRYLDKPTHFEVRDGQY
jgi:nucleoside-diphosphate-sugar epimerase